MVAKPSKPRKYQSSHGNKSADSAASPSGRTQAPTVKDIVNYEPDSGAQNPNPNTIFKQAVSSQSLNLETPPTDQKATFTDIASPYLIGDSSPEILEINMQRCFKPNLKAALSFEKLKHSQEEDEIFMPH